MQMWVLGANHQTELRDPGGGAGRRTDWRSRGELQSHRKNNIGWSDHPVLPQTRPLTKECTWREGEHPHLGKREGGGQMWDGGLVEG